MDPTQASPFSVRIARGPRGAEAILVEDVLGKTAELGRRVLREPILVVVPSHSLRVHALGRLTHAAGGAIAGVDCTTLRGLALRIVRAAEGARPPTADLFPLFARRFARAEPDLVRSLEPLRDGFSAVLGTVRDLLDAGLDSAHVEALDDALAAEGPEVSSKGELQRARSLVRVAASTVRALEHLGLYRPSALLQRASRAIAEGAQPAPGHLVVYGFSDATGTATDLLLEALRQWGGTLVLDRPPDPAQPDTEDPGAVFGRRFAERILAAGHLIDEPPAEAPVAEVHLVRAMGASAEVREVAYRVERLLADGTRPEAIGIVARDFRQYRSPLRIQFQRLGIPFSAVDLAGPAGPATRRVRAVLDLLANERATPVERWLDARGKGFRGAPPFDLRLALFSLGAGRLYEVAELDVDSLVDGDTFPLPVRHGFFQVEEDEAGEDDPRNEVHLRRRRIPASALEEAAQAARSLCRRFDRPREDLTLARRLAEVRSLLFGELGWTPEDEAGQEVLTRLEQSLSGVPEELELDRDELVTLLRESLEDAGRVRFGGAGSGVQVLDVTEARGRTFEALFLLGLNRSVFPRAVREDPILPDALRSVLAREGHGVLPDLPLKRAGFDEERYLFAQLLAAAPVVTLSWQDVDEDNAVLAASPLVERLRWTEGGEGGRVGAEAYSARGPYAPADPEPGGQQHLQPAFEHSVIAALRGRREEVARILPLALGEADSDAVEHRLEGPHRQALDELAAARMAVLAEQDPKPGSTTRKRLGPYFGWVGAPTEDLDPRRAESLYVTTLERLCGCPWQVLLERVLRIQPLPDPLEVLPGIDALVVGDLIHVVAERIVNEAHAGRADSLDEARAREPQLVPWPEPEHLEAMVFEEAGDVARRHGIGLPGFDRILARRIHPYLEVIHRLDWGSGPISNLSAEARGSVRLTDRSGRERSIAFKVDRLDSTPDGLVFSDYKSGRLPVSSAKREQTRRGHLLRDVRAGSRLQTVAYVLAGGGEGDRGRYLFLNPEMDAPEASREAAVGGSDRDLLEAFQGAALTALATWNRGGFFPRLVEPTKDRAPKRCGFCTVKEACLQGDTGARARLREWIERPREAAPDGAEGSVLDTWNLGLGARQ